MIIHHLHDQCYGLTILPLLHSNDIRRMNNWLLPPSPAGPILSFIHIYFAFPFWVGGGRSGLDTSIVFNKKKKKGKNMYEYNYYHYFFGLPLGVEGGRRKLRTKHSILSRKRKSEHVMRRV